ncbi:hypothetical protein HX848_00420 [Marine Group I thaumarchaeote]|uniref:LEA type 2 family protein n=1 Tax=Marine Group I thaumarchaeote TaxID=2511932 RepID=A0A7K4MF90_9ARCH|nr:hypothetical protein [Marine Group I thaumarchaeote]
MALQSKITVYAALVGVVALMGGIFFYGSLDNVQLEQVEIKLINVELRDVSTKDNQAKFDITFLVKNPSDKTFTVPLIEYQLYGDGILLGSGEYSTIDIAMPGRAAFFPDTEIPLKSTFILFKSEVNSEIYQDAIENRINSFSAEGIITTQSSWMTLDKEFKTGF